MMIGGMVFVLLKVLFWLWMQVKMPLVQTDTTDVHTRHEVPSML